MEVTTQLSPQEVLSNIETRFSSTGVKIENRTENSITYNVPQPFSCLEMAGVVIAGFFTFGLSLLAIVFLHMTRRISVTATAIQENGVTRVSFKGDERVLPASEEIALAFAHGEKVA